uniref:Ell-associated factor Eaf n=1 Tax=Hirondellea gigas TaxID=1518452 RepID=A0A2P2IED5_9CRUS
MSNGPKANGREILPKDFFMDGKTRPLKIGRSFLENSNDDDNEEFLSITYDFKPPSAEKSTTTLELGPDNNVSINVYQNNNDENTLYKGSVQEGSKDCFLIIDHVTGEITLEKVSNIIRVKRTREAGCSGGNRQHPSTPQDSNRMGSNIPPVFNSMPDLDFDEEEDGAGAGAETEPRGQQPQATVDGGGATLSESSSSSSSSSSSDSDSDSDTGERAPKYSRQQPQQQPLQQQPIQQQKQQLSDSGISSKVLMNDLDLSSASEDE